VTSARSAYTVTSTILEEATRRGGTTAGDRAWAETPPVDAASRAIDEMHVRKRMGNLPERV
jgi:hypothetical protein